jgi:putative RecB family exonuclease
MELQELRKQSHLSASSINDYVECGLLYKLGRIDKVPMEFVADALELGTCVHLVLAEFYQEKMIGNKLRLKDVLHSFETQWRFNAEARDDIRYAEEKDFETLLMEGKELLTAWYDKLPDDDFKVIAIEEPFTFNIPGVSVPVIGGIDLIEEDESGTIIVTDWKTSGRAYSIDEVDNNMQLTVYQLALKANGFAEREMLLKFDCLIKTKVPKFEQYWTTRGEMDEKRLERKVIQVWEGISKGVFIPNDTSWKCKGCPYQKACAEWFLKEEGSD